MACFQRHKDHFAIVRGGQLAQCINIFLCDKIIDRLTVARRYSIAYKLRCFGFGLRFPFTCFGLQESRFTLTLGIENLRALFPFRYFNRGLTLTYLLRDSVEQLIAAGPDADARDHALLRGWRGAFIGEALRDLLRGEKAVTVDPTTALPRLVPGEEQVNGERADG